MNISDNLWILHKLSFKIRTRSKGKPSETVTLQPTNPTLLSSQDDLKHIQPSDNLKASICSLVVVAEMAVTLIVATAFATDSAFAGGHGHKMKTEYNQATFQVNDSGNGFEPFSVG